MRWLPTRYDLFSSLTETKDMSNVRRVYASMHCFSA
jgi:hypothetical protein